ncbi:1,4-alpha-glucan branching enzyme GlgB [Clostridia bacterium]|nr:1,4-alpha-glucan branching enzyme GlgB [Clostridia bacterium]
MNDLRYLYNEDYLNKVVNSHSDYPGGLLGPHLTQSGFLVSVFYPQASHVQVIDKETGNIHDTTAVTDNGLFGVLLGSNTNIDYYLRIFPYNGTPFDIEDHYRFPAQTTAFNAYLLGQGTDYNIYNNLGAHIKTINGISGVLFTVWAPNAARVSVLGNFNNWDGRIHQMNRVQDVGIFELFIPKLSEGELYKFEIKTHDGAVLIKTDPFGNYQQMRPETASVVSSLSGFVWADEQWLNTRKAENPNEKPIAIYELHLGSWKKGGENKDQYMNYREIAPQLAAYILDMGYTHIELMGISEHPFDGSWGYQVTGYYAPTSRFGSPQDFMYFVDYMHQKGISVILDWVPAHFPKDAHGLGRFDGTCLYEHPDSRRGEHPQWGTYIFNYGRNEVKNFLIGSALFWVEKFHIDGLRVDAVASMLYLDYGKEGSDWCPNIYGGHENLEAVEFLKHLNSIMYKRNPGAIVIAEESTSWPDVTTATDDGGLGFNFKWNMGWMNDFLHYVSTDPLYKIYHHDQLTFSMVYAYSEKFILVLSHDEVVYGKCSMINKMPGDDYQKHSNLKTTYGFMFAHPGKKLLFMGQDFAQSNEWNDAKELDWHLLEQAPHKQMQLFVKDLLHLYTSHPAFYLQDYVPDGFQWGRPDDKENSVVTFLRKTESGENSLLFVFNFVPNEHKDFTIGVPSRGFYKPILFSDDEIYGGSGQYKNIRRVAKKGAADKWQYNFQMDIPPLSVTIFEYKHQDPPEATAAEGQ